ncbi:MAG: hypothetical protein JST75_01460 [Bacteroidetes bacterium]|nr:hypothetical protein [Bacteroidota bacterium]
MYYLNIKNRPIAVIIVAILFIVTGGLGIAYHLKDFAEANADLLLLIWVLFVRILAIVCGFLLLFRIKWARWLAIVWLAYHILISALNSTNEMIAHIVFLILVSILLFLPTSSAYFQNKK